MASEPPTHGPVATNTLQDGATSLVRPSKTTLGDSINATGSLDRERSGLSSGQNSQKVDKIEGFLPASADHGASAL